MRTQEKLRVGCHLCTRRGRVATKTPRPPTSESPTNLREARQRIRTYEPTSRALPATAAVPHTAACLSREPCGCARRESPHMSHERLMPICGRKAGASARSDESCGLNGAEAGLKGTAEIASQV